MPHISVEGPILKDVEKKRKLVADMTAAATQAYGVPKEAIVVVITENSPENVGVAGVLIADRGK
ncbi:MAG: 4-oxalocrotonate tautomerase DmpI [Thermodesulfobacteriota bacterium]